MKTLKTNYQNEGTEIINNEKRQFADKNSSNDTTQESAGTWKKVAIGGGIGIVLGSGAIYAANKSGLLESIFAENGLNDVIIDEKEESEDNVEDNVEISDGSEVAAVATTYSDNAFVIDNQLSFAHTSQGLSFSEAFAEARSEVGAGGVFIWNDNVYGTYYANEWDRMSAEEKAEFGSHITYLGQKSEAESGQGSIVAEAEASDSDIKIIEVTNELLEDDSVVIVEHIETQGQELYIVDTDQDGIFDISLTDPNNDGVVSNSEYYQISDQGLAVNEVESISENQVVADTSLDYSNDDIFLA